MLHRVYTSIWWHHDCWLTVQTLYAIYTITPGKLSQGHVQNGRRATFSWPTLSMYIYICMCVCVCVCVGVCILWRCNLTRAYSVSMLRFLDHTTRQTHTRPDYLNEWSDCQYNTQHTHYTNTHALSEIWTRDPSSQAASDLRLIPLGNRCRYLTVCESSSDICYW